MIDEKRLGMRAAEIYNDINRQNALNPTTTVTLYADNQPYASVIEKRTPLVVEDWESGKYIVLCENASISQVAWMAANGDISFMEGLFWCENYKEPIRKFYELYHDALEDMKTPKQVEKQTEPWPYRLVAFINHLLEILLNSILEDFL